MGDDKELSDANHSRHSPFDDKYDMPDEKDIHKLETRARKKEDIKQREQKDVEETPADMDDALREIEQKHGIGSFDEEISEGTKALMGILKDDGTELELNSYKITIKPNVGEAKSFKLCRDFCAITKYCAEISKFFKHLQESLDSMEAIEIGFKMPNLYEEKKYGNVEEKELYLEGTVETPKILKPFVNKHYNRIEEIEVLARMASSSTWLNKYCLNQNKTEVVDKGGRVVLKITYCRGD